MCTVIVNLAVILLVSSLAMSAVFFEENFDDDNWKNTWVYSRHPGKHFGKFVGSAGRFYNDPVAGRGLQTAENARFYAISRRFSPLSTENKPFVLQFSVKHEQHIDCGGGYVKLYNCSLDQKDMHGGSPYEIMFGPDICGSPTIKVQLIISYKGKFHRIKKDIRFSADVFTHFYTLIVLPNNRYHVLIDNEEFEVGSLQEDFNLLPPKKIKDPKVKKPKDWDDRKFISDRNDRKPKDWDKPKYIPDPNAIKPEDWLEEMDGEWEPPLIDNPEFKGLWRPRQLPNPNYRGRWEHPMIKNPEYKIDPNLYVRKELCIIGLDLWQVKSGTIFDNILLTDDVDLAAKAAATVKQTQDGERKMKEKRDKDQYQETYIDIDQSPEDYEI